MSYGQTKRACDDALAAAGVLATPGSVFYVSSTSGNAGNDGMAPDRAKATIAQGVALCTASKGDVVCVLPGHAETISAAGGLTISKAGVSVVGVGEGSLKPTLTYSAAAATTIISAANVMISGIKFACASASAADVVVFLTVSENWARIRKCEFWGNSTYQFVNAIGLTTTYDYARIEGCTFWQDTDPAATDAAAGTGCIYMEDSEHVRITGCEFNGNFETAFIHNKTTAAADLWVDDCRGICSLATATPFELVSTATGGVEDSSFITPAEVATTEATLSGTFGAGFFNFRTFFGNDGGGGQLAIASQAAAS